MLTSWRMKHRLVEAGDRVGVRGWTVRTHRSFGVLAAAAPMVDSRCARHHGWSDGDGEARMDGGRCVESRPAPAVAGNG